MKYFKDNTNKCFQNSAYCLKIRDIKGICGFATCIDVSGHRILDVSTSSSKWVHLVLHLVC